MAVTQLSQAVLAGMDPNVYRNLQDIQTGEALSQQGMDSSPTSKWGAWGRLANALAGSYLTNSATSDLAKTIAAGKKSAADLWLQKAAANMPQVASAPQEQPGVSSSSVTPKDQNGVPAASPAASSPQAAAENPASPNYAGAISKIESGGRYNLLGPVTKTGDRAYGKFQVMGANIPEWSQAALGKTLTPQQFLDDPGAQEAIFKHRFGQYVDKYGIDGAARAWFAGEHGMNNPDARDQLGTTVQSYADQFEHGLQDQPAVQAINAAAGARPVRIASVAAPVAARNGNPETTSATPGAGLGVSELMQILHHPYSSDEEKALASKLILQKMSPDEFASGSQGIYNKNTGEIKTPAAAKQEWQVIDTDKVGKPVYGYPPSPQEYAARPRVAAKPDPLEGVQGPQRLDLLKQMDPARASQVQAVLEGRTPYPTGSRLNPQQQQLKEDVTQVDPNFTSGTYLARNNFLKSMAGTAPGTFGGQVRSAGTVAKHLGDADDAIATIEKGKLGAGDTLPSLNGWKGYIRNQSGDREYQDAIGHYETARKGLSDEVETLLAGGHGAEGSKAYWLDRLDLNKHGPTEVRGALDEFRSLMNGRISNVAQERDRIFGDEPGHTDPLTLFGPHEREIMQRIQNHTWGAKRDEAQPGKPATAPAPITPPAPALARLIASPTPQMKRDFDDVFGAGAADRALGGK